jgi:hypothetical protein
MRKNAKHILYFFLAMIVIILIRMGSFFAYDITSFYEEKNQDNLTDVLLINLTEISLVVVITQSLRWSLLKYQEYVDGQILSNSKNDSSQINIDEYRRSNIAGQGLDEDENSCEIPVAMHSKSLLRQIEDSNMTVR